MSPLRKGKPSNQILHSVWLNFADYPSDILGKSTLTQNNLF